MGVPWLVPLVALFGFSVAFDDWHTYRLVWQDEFDRLDMGKWQYEVTASGGGNSEFQVYTPSSANSYVRNGALHIKPTVLAESINPRTGAPFGADFMRNGVLDLNYLYGSCTNNDNNGCYRTGNSGNIPPVLSARLRSYQRFSFTYGRTVIRAKMPVGDWMWPAIWMLPENWEYGGWPASGEIDIVESVGNRNYVDRQGQMLGIQKMGSALHWGPRWDQNRYYLSNLPKWSYANNYGDSYHTYILDWSTNGLRFYIDDETNPLLDVPYPLVSQNPTWVNFWEWGKPWAPDVSNPWTQGTNLAPFDKNFHFVLNVAVGGLNGFIPDGGINHGGNPSFQKPWNNYDDYITAMNKFYNRVSDWKWTWDQEGENAALQIDYIRVYQKI